MLWLVPIVLAVWGVVQIADGGQPQSLDVPQPVTPAATTSAPPAPSPTSSPIVPPMRRSIPTRVLIRSVWINAAVDQIGLTRDGRLETPSYERADNAAWYKYGPTPGEAGPAVIVGHVDSKTERAVFFELRHVDPGDIIEITRADESKVRFRVDSIEQFPKSRFPTERVYGDTPNPTLRLITCGGRFDEERKDYLDNIIVFASMIPESGRLNR